MKKTKDALAEANREAAMTSVTLFKIPGDDFAWRAVAIETLGDQVISKTDICKPDIRAIVQERFKIWVANHFFKR